MARNARTPMQSAHRRLAKLKPAALIPPAMLTAVVETRPLDYEDVRVVIHRLEQEADQVAAAHRALRTLRPSVSPTGGLL